MILWFDWILVRLNCRWRRKLPHTYDIIIVILEKHQNYGYTSFYCIYYFTSCLRNLYFEKQSIAVQNNCYILWLFCVLHVLIVLCALLFFSLKSQRDIKWHFFLFFAGDCVFYFTDWKPWSLQTSMWVYILGIPLELTMGKSKCLLIGNCYLATTNQIPLVGLFWAMETKKGVYLSSSAFGDKCLRVKSFT